MKIALALLTLALLIPAAAPAQVTFETSAPVELHSSDDYYVLPFATPRIEPGTYFLRITGTAKSSPTSQDQLFLKTTFGMDGGPTLSASNLRQVGFYGPDGQSYAGSLANQTTNPPNEQSLDASTGEVFFIMTGTVVVTNAGYLSLAVGGYITEGESWTLKSCSIIMTPQ